MNGEGGPPDGDVLVVDIGKHKKKRVKDLRRGKGTLVDKVKDVVDEIRQGLTADQAMPTIVVVVREKRRRRRGPPGLFG